jgi:hypothetical protein
MRQQDAVVPGKRRRAAAKQFANEHRGGGSVFHNAPPCALFKRPYAK